MLSTELWYITGVDYSDLQKLKNRSTAAYQRRCTFSSYHSTFDGSDSRHRVSLTNRCRFREIRVNEKGLLSEALLLTNPIIYYADIDDDNTSHYAACISLIFSRILFSISLASSGLSWSNCFTVSRPWPSLSAL